MIKNEIEIIEILGILIEVVKGIITGVECFTIKCKECKKYNLCIQLDKIGNRVEEMKNIQKG